MATVTKDFRIKSGLVVEGTSGTINGNIILTSADTTSAVDEGTNLYYTNERVDDRVANLVSAGTGIAVGYNDLGNVLSISTDFTEFSTSDITEGTNLYFTDERAQDAVGNSLGDGLKYTDASGAIEADLASAGGLKVDALGQLAVNETYTTTNSGSQTLINKTIDTASNYITVVAADVSDFTAAAIAAVGGSATSLNTPDTVVKRDISGAFAAGEITADSVVTNNISFAGAMALIGEGVNVTAPSGNIVLDAAFGNAYLTSVSEGNQIATHNYVDTAISGLNWKESANLFAKTINVPLTGATETVVIDGHTPLDSVASGYRLLLTGQTTASENGLYLYVDNGSTYSLARTEDANNIEELLGAAIFVMEGTAYGSTSWVQSNTYAATFEDLLWTQFSGTGAVTAGEGISIDGVSVSIDRVTVDAWYDASGSASTAQSNAESFASGLSVNYDAAGVAAQALVDAKAYADALTTTDIAEGTALYFTDTRAVDALEAVVPNFTEVDINSIAKQVAATFVTIGGTEIVYAFSSAAYRSAKLLIKLARGTHTEISEVLITLDTADNIAMTEYAIVGTNGPLGVISAIHNGVSNLIQITVNTPSPTSIKIFGTLVQ